MILYSPYNVNFVLLFKKFPILFCIRCAYKRNIAQFFLRWLNVIEAAYPLTHNYQDKEFINITRAERDAALVKVDDDGAAAAVNPDIPFGSSASLASSQVCPMKVYLTNIWH